MKDMTAASILEPTPAASPALAAHTPDRLLGEVWTGPDLSQRDRNLD